MEQTQAEAAPPEDSRSSLVVLGSSAGGIDALLTVVGGLPGDFPAPVVVAQHLDPHHESRLADLLASRSNLPVRAVTGHLQLEPGLVYVVPTSHDVEITDYAIDLVMDGTGRSHPSVDRLMVTAATVFRENLIGVVLTGTGADGTAGAQAVKAYGGTVIVQNPDSARFSGMPGSVPRASVDIVAELEAIAGLLVDLCRGDYALPPAEDDSDMHVFLDRVRGQTGLDFSAYKRPTIERRLRRRMLAVGVDDIREYQRYVDRDPEEMQRLVASFLIKVTRFFRDAELYEYLRDSVLPRLLADARERGELRIWSAGCATGEEAYSLAMLIRDLQADGPPTVPVRIFATDVAPDAVEFARHGVFPEAALESVPTEMIERHFVRLDSGYQVRKSVRGLVIFGEHDLSRRAPFPRIDLVLCRNVLIYFTPDLQRRALQLFAFSLRSGGYLALGKAESVSPLPEYFTLELSHLKLFRRVGGEAPVPVGRIADSLATRSSGNTSSPTLAREVSRVPEQLERPQQMARQSARIIDAMSVGVVTVDRNYHIRSINVAARRLMNIHSAAMSEDLIHRVPPEIAQPLRAGVDAGFRGETVVTDVRLNRDVVDDGGRDFAVTFTPVPFEPEGNIVESVMLEIVDITAIANERRDMERTSATLQAERDQLHDRMVAAISEIRALRAAGQSMAIEQGRLRVENEQLQIASEEAQAAAEEIETLNEEQQASNEELETLNEELQATVEELNTTNADLQARTIELETLAHTNDQQRRESERERTQLHAMLTNMSEAVLVLSSSQQVVLTNPAWDRLLGSPEAFVPEDEAGQPLPESIWSFGRVLAGEPFTLEFTRPSADGSRRWFEASVQPIPGDREQGGMVVVRDITDRSLRRLQERFLAIASHELRTPLTTLSGSIQLMARRLQNHPSELGLGKHVDRAWEQIRRLQLIIGELTDISRLRGGIFEADMREVDLRDIVRDAVDIARDLSGQTALRPEIPDEPVMTSGDPARLEQVLLNLMINAFRHARDSVYLDVRLRREGDAAVIEVQDYGPGIPEPFIPEIFTQFNRATHEARSQSGLGLGLFIAREIVTAHRGTIDVRSALGEGATFEIRLPLLSR